MKNLQIVAIISIVMMTVTLFALLPNTKSLDLTAFGITIKTK